MGFFLHFNWPLDHPVSKTIHLKKMTKNLSNNFSYNLRNVKFKVSIRALWEKIPPFNSTETLEVTALKREAIS